MIAELRSSLLGVTMAQAQRCAAVGMVLLALTSYGAGAVRSRGGVVHELGLTSITFGHTQGMLVLLMWVALGLIIVSWIIAGGRIVRRGESLPRSLVLWWTVPYLFTGPLMSRDVYSYLMQGTLARDGFDAYEVGAAANPGPLLYEVSADWRNTTTPYGPLHLGLMELITRISGEAVAGGLALLTLCAGISIAVIYWGVRRIAPLFDVDPDLAVWLGVCNPLILLHLLGGMHTENIMMALVVLGLLLVLRSRNPWLGLLAATVLVATAAALKATAVLALPGVVWIAVARIAGEGPRSWWKETPRRLLTLLLAAGGAGVLTLAVIAGWTLITGQTWGWIAEMSGNTKVINPLAFPSFLASTIAAVTVHINEDVTFNVLVALIRPLSTLIMALGVVAACWFFRRSARVALAGTVLAYLVTCVFNAVALPWYFAPPLIILALIARSPRVILLSAWASMWLALMFDGGGNNRLYVMSWVVGIALITGWLAVTALGIPLRRRATPHPASATIPASENGREGSTKQDVRSPSPVRGA